MYTKICSQLGIEYPIFAFSHCRDVVAAVSRAGGLGVLGAGWFTPAEFRQELDWIDANIGDAPYGIDVVIPQKYEGMDESDSEALEKRLWQQVPAEHLTFAKSLMAERGIPDLPKEEADKSAIAGWTYATSLPLFLEVLGRPNCKLVANALGTPPPDIVDKAHDNGMLIGALCGKVKQAVAHKNAGLDFIIAVGGEGGGHCGEIGSVVLWPQIVDAVAPVPVLCGGGVGNGRQMLAAMAMGAAGVWTGTLWVTVEEAAEQPATKLSYLNATSEDTVRTKAWTGKPARVIRNDWSDAWDSADSPEPLGMPLQGLVTNNAMRRGIKYAGAPSAQSVAMNPVGQVIGQINEVESCRSAVYRLIEEYLEALDHVNSQMPET
jgi:NAD(P)H-dependent flavin oxidoreductase YrpB (nitropropane dioxygenase family)